MAAKDIDPLSDGIDNESIEAGAQDWILTCGTCHVGGGQMEYDRDQVAYDNNQQDGDNMVFNYDYLDGVGAMVRDTAPSPAYASATNKAEVDCLMCHFNFEGGYSAYTDGNNYGTGWHYGDGANGNGRALYQTWGCGPLMPVGPANDPTCSGTSSMPGVPAAGPFIPGTAYDMYNRNYAVKTRNLEAAASMGMGAVGQLNAQGAVIGVDWGAAYDATQIDTTGDGNPDSGAVVIPGAIAGTPKSENCAPCHARDDATVGITSMVGMKTGYGNYLLAFQPGQIVDTDQPGTDPATEVNTKAWFDFGCKTGMGKRTHKIGMAPIKLTAPGAEGDEASALATCSGATVPAGMECRAICEEGWYAGDSSPHNCYAALVDVVGPMARYSPAGMAVQMGMAAAGDPIPGKMPDIDVHDAAQMNCATCHYMIGGKNDIQAELHQVCSGDESVACTTDADCAVATGTCITAREIHAHDSHGVSYPTEFAGNMDHHFAQGDSYPDTKGKNNLDATVTCESCHVDGTHPQVVNGNLTVPAVGHVGLPASHITKIACATCHIPQVYAAPGRLKYRDWTVGWYKGGFRNMLDWNFDLVSGSHAAVPNNHMWLNKFGATKIYPVLPSVMPIWVEALSYADGTATVDNEGQDFNYYIDNVADPDGTTNIMSPVKNRVVQAAAEMVRDNHPEHDIRINGGNAVPLFDGFVLADSWEIDTAAEVNDMIAAFKTIGTADVKALKLFQANFDVTHGVVPSEWALGGSQRGGCVSCHSSMNPNDPGYNTNSVGFFGGYVQPLNNAAPLLASYGLPTDMALGGFDTIKNWFAMFADFDCSMLCQPMTTFGMIAGDTNGDGVTNVLDADMNLFDPMTGAPLSGTACDAMSPLNAMGGGSSVIDMCAGFMYDMMDAAMGFPTAPTDGVCTANVCVGGAAPGSPCADDTTCTKSSAKNMGFHDGIQGLRAFTVKETVSGNLEGCNPMTNPAACSTHTDGPLWYSRGEARSHFKIDLQQSYNAAGKKQITWPVPGTNDGTGKPIDMGNLCIDYRGGATCDDTRAPCTDDTDCNTGITCQASLGPEDATLGNMFGPAVSACVGADGTPGTGDEPYSFDGQLHIPTMIPANMYLQYTDGYLRTLMLPPRADENEVNFFASATATQDAVTSYEVDFDASNSQCGVFTCDPVLSTCTGGTNVGNACTDYTDCPGACSSFDWEFTDLAGASLGSDSGVTVSKNTGNTTAYRATLTVGDGSGITASTSKLVAGAAVVTPTYPTLTGVGSTDASGTASLTIVSNGYTVLGSYIDWRDKKRQRVKTLGPHSHTYTFVGTGMTYSAKVRVTYIDHLDGNRVKNKFVIQPLYVE